MTTDKVYRGYVMFFNYKGSYGFIHPKEEIQGIDSYKGIFFHKSNSTVDIDYPIKIGDEVSYTLAKDIQGRLKAINVYFFGAKSEEEGVPNVSYR